MRTVLTIPELVHGLNGDKGLIRMPFRERQRLKDTWTWLFISQALGNKHKGRVKVTITRYCLKPLEDFDNLAATMKIPMDAVKAAEIIKDDKIKIIGQPTFYQIKVKSENQQKYVIEIEDIEE